MLPLLFLTIFLAAGVTANKAAAKYQLLFFYELYRVEVDAFGLKNTRMAPDCVKDGAVCDLKAFVKEVCKVNDKALQYDANGKPIKQPNGRPIFVTQPDFSKVDWENIGDGEDLKKFTEEFGKSGFMGDVFNDKIFKGWNKVDNFANVMDEANDIGEKAIDQLKKDGKGDNDHLKRMTAALEVHYNARRADQAEKINKAFEVYMKKNKFDVKYTGLIERPPVSGYRKIDAGETINANKNKVGFGKVEPKVMSFVADQNSAGQGKTHLDAIFKSKDIHQHLANACKP